MSLLEGMFCGIPAKARAIWIEVLLDPGTDGATRV
jgi:hypothetical protein